MTLLTSLTNNHAHRSRQDIFCVKLETYTTANQLASTADDWIGSDLARAAHFSLSSFNETMDSLTSLMRHSNLTSFVISDEISLEVSCSFRLSSSSLRDNKFNKFIPTILLTSSGHNMHVTWFCKHTGSYFSVFWLVLLLADIFGEGLSLPSFMFTVFLLKNDKKNT